MLQDGTGGDGARPGFGRVNSAVARMTYALFVAADGRDNPPGTASNVPVRCASISGRRPGPHAVPRREPPVSIIRVGLSETNKFAEGYDAILGKKQNNSKKKPAAPRNQAAKKAKKKKG